MNKNEDKLFQEIRDLFLLRAKRNFLDFILYTDLDYEVNWHHEYIANRIQDFINSDSKYLMIFVPPQHGKSEITSRKLPAYLFGKNPNLRIAGISYSKDLELSFSRDIQRIMKSQFYKDVFPNTRLSETNKTDAIKTANEFEIVGYKGSYKAVGILGGLSGRRVDIAIIDDPVKDAMEANSPVYRQRVWEWYLNVLRGRLHNDSKVLLIMTRWHEEDLAGKLLKEQGDKWEVIKIPAICEEKNEFDPRKIGEALWENRHSLESLLDLKALSGRTFASLYQQRPAPVEGNILKKEWFYTIPLSEVPKNIAWDVFLDTAFTDKTTNDPTGFLVVGDDIANKRMIVRYFGSEYLEMPDLLKRLPEVIKMYGGNEATMVYVEPKASGLSLIQLIRNETYINITAIKNKLVQVSKIERANYIAPYAESSRIALVEGNWNDAYIDELTMFPNAAHDEAIDTTAYACRKYLHG